MADDWKAKMIQSQTDHISQIVHAAKRIHVMRSEIWIANLGTPHGSEQRGIRPVLILQNDIGNHFAPTVIVASITNAPKKMMPTHVPISTAESGLWKDSTILLEQIRTIDKSALDKKTGALTPELMARVEYAVRISLGLDPPILKQSPPPKKLCSTPGCRDVLYAKELCKRHYAHGRYQRLRREREWLVLTGLT